MALLDRFPIAREGVWLYDQSVPVCIRVVASPETWGTGDFEDEESVAENQAIPCFFIVYESAGSPGNFNNVIPNIETLESAYQMAESKFPGIEWRTKP
ncbi:hypothetical protein [Uliginosibacterium sediminicola]|uniref:Uncharacterized protein n=1 Tax=Uliginosibacterium sediminicola TaxID=2024550 RepID=A0ABU9YY18_9RHOO